MSESTYIIAEAGVNHNGRDDLALELVDVAAAAGADAVKFQTFKADRLAVETAEMCDYQVRNTGRQEGQREMLKRLELSREAHFLVAERCRQKNIDFLSSPFDLGSLAFLVEEMDLPVIKVPSGEITNGPYLLGIAQSGRRTILSTGMAELDEIADAVDLLAWGYLGRGAKGRAADFKGARLTAEGAAILKQKLTILHCTSEYPAPFETVNLRAMQTLREQFGVPVGLSDHSEGIAMPIAAVALGAVVIEKHFTLDKTMEGPDHKASLDPAQLRSMVEGIRAVELGLGTAEKSPSAAERRNRTHVRKSLVVDRPIAAGAVIVAEDLDAKRPGTGISPMRFWDTVGQVARRAYRPGDLLD
jgi:N-acetylneuraminate synthase